MLEKVTNLTPIAVLAERSRDASGYPTISQMEPHGVFMVTDNRRRVTARLLRDYDMVTICGSGGVPYSKTERTRLREFVERGGTLVLAASAGEFEASAERPASRLSVSGVAREFGFEFLSAAGYPACPWFNFRHLPIHDLELTAAGKKVGLTLRETFLWYPAPIRTPKGATVLLREKRTHAPIAARARFGRGTVLVWGDSALWGSGWTELPATLHLAAVAPRRRKPASRPPVILDVPRESTSEGVFTVRSSPFARPRAERVLELAAEVWKEMCLEFAPAKRPKRILVHLEPGCMARGAPGGRGGEEFRCFLGADCADSGIVTALVRLFGFSLLLPWWGWRRWHGFILAAQRVVQGKVLRRLGLTAAADSWDACVAGGSTVDMGRQYSQRVQPPPGAYRLFLDLEAEFGAGTLRRACRRMPKKDPFGDLPEGFYSALDGLAYHLARSAGAGVYDWLEENGHTVRRVPLLDPGSDDMRKAIRRTLRGAFLDPSLPVSDRLNAARVLAKGPPPKKEDKKPKPRSISSLVRAAAGRRPEHAVPAALALAGLRDERGRAPLRRWLDAKDDGIAGIAALNLVADYGDADCPDRLVRLAEGADTRFRLTVGQALARVDDPRADEFSFAHLDGCRFDRWENGILRIYAQVDGFDVAVVNTGPTWHARGAGTAVSRSYVFWVHTYGPFRRLGLARTCLGRALLHRWAGTCSENALHAMTDYFAHALYRDLQMVDSERYRGFKKPPEDRRRRAPRGVRIRPAGASDLASATDLVNRVCRLRPIPISIPRDWPGPDIALVAEESRKIVGVAAFRGAELWDLAVDDRIEKKERRESIGLALLAAAERAHRARKTKEMSAHSWFWYGDGFHLGLLNRAGFGSTLSTLVEQTRLANLGRMLNEMGPLLEARLAGEKSLDGYAGSIGIQAGRFRETLRIGKGRVQVTARSSKRPTLHLRGDEEAWVRILHGMATPFDEFNQMRLTVRPALSGASRKLLETLFPKTMAADA